MLKSSGPGIKTVQISACVSQPQLAAFRAFVDSFDIIESQAFSVIGVMRIVIKFRRFFINFDDAVISMPIHKLPALSSHTAMGFPKRASPGAIDAKFSGTNS